MTSGMDGAATAKTHAAGHPARLTRYVPILSWLPHYERSWLPLDILAGLTLWGLMVPEAMAYAGIAGLPPQAGLYTLVVALLVYAVLGSSRHLAVAATSATAALLASSVTAVIASAGANASSAATYRGYASAFILMTGIVFLVAGVARLGFITQFLSKPVMDGFVTGLAIFVAVGQLNKLFGVAKPDGNTVQKFLGILKELPDANWVTFAVAVVSLALLFVLPLLSKKVPAGLVVLFGAIALSSVLNLDGSHGVAVVGSLPKGLPAFSVPDAPLSAYIPMVLPAIGVLLVAFSEALGVAQEFASKHGYEIDPNQELNAHAAANVVSAFFGGMLAGGSMSASAVKEGAGARTQLSNLVTWVATILTLLFLTPVFKTLPEAVLGALIIHAVWHIIASRKLSRLRHESKTEFVFGVLAFLGVVLIGVLEGMVIGLVVSLLFVIYRSTRPHVASLGKVPGAPGAYSDLCRHAEDIPVPGVLIVRLDAPIYYANAVTFRDAVKAMIAESEPPPGAVIFDAEEQADIDVTSVDVMTKLLTELLKRDIEVYFANVHDLVLEKARKMGLLRPADEDRVFPTLDAAVDHIKETKDPGAPES